MLRPFRPAFENLEKREVFAAGLLVGLGSIGATAAATEPAAWSIGNIPGTEPVAWSLGATNVHLRVVSSANNQSGVAVQAGNGSAVTQQDFDLGWPLLNSAPGSEPLGLATQEGVPEADPNAVWASQPSAVDHTPDHAPDVLNVAAKPGPSARGLTMTEVLVATSLAARSHAAAHDAVFAELGRTGGEFLGLEREHPSILTGYLLP